jgi:hypothetical protein
MERGLWGRGLGKQWTEKESFQQYFYNRYKILHTYHTYCCYAYHFTRIGCTLFTCDMYMCRLRHINNSVLSSLKMEGIRLLFISLG